MIVSTVSQALLWAVLGLGIFVTFRILNFPDMTTEGSFPLGGAVAVTLLTQGVHPILATLAAVLVGCLAGFSQACFIPRENSHSPGWYLGHVFLSLCHSIYHG